MILLLLLETLPRFSARWCTGCLASIQTSGSRSRLVTRTPCDEAHTHRPLAFWSSSGTVLGPVASSPPRSRSRFFQALLGYPLALLALFSAPAPPTLSMFQRPLAFLAEPDFTQSALTPDSSAPGSSWQKSFWTKLQLESQAPVLTWSLRQTWNTPRVFSRLNRSIV